MKDFQNLEAMEERPKENQDIWHNFFMSIKASKCKRCMKNWGNVWNKYYKVVVLSMYKEQLQLYKKNRHTHPTLGTGVK